MNYLWATLLSVFVVACSNSESARPSDQSGAEKDSGYAGTEDMVLLQGGSVTVGSNDKSFRANERPAMKVLLDYEFYMGIHEVTCGDYAEVAQKADLKTFEGCDNDSLPIVDITYYDAILFANAKSKRDGYDTAYTYSKAIFDSDGHCTNLEGFAFHADVKAFRLPTEAEWIFAATRAWDTGKSWNNGNSGYRLHAVCSKDTNSAGLCDMAGNAMEWVNDWMGTFRDTTVTNYVGAPDGGDMGERIVKGGSYSTSEKELNPYSRGDVYTVTSSTRAEYVGFRLAFGNIPNALYMDNDGKLQTSVITALTGNETVKAITGSYNVKLAFRNDVSGNIAIIDYLNGASSVKEITKNIDAYHPEISPDGKWIAYCIGFEGVSGKSVLYVQNIEEGKAMPVKLGVESAAIPRWRVLETGDTAIVYVTDAGNNKDNSWKSQSTWQVPFANGKFGTPQKLFDGAYHGGISGDNALAVTGARLLRARIDGRDTVWYDSAQACNVSLAQDGSKRTAFLDFGGTPGQKFAGESYATHERILVADNTGKLIQSIKSPAGYTFDHTEWATDGEKSVIVATLANMNGAHTKIVLVNPLDSSVTELAEGEELWHPNLWIKKKAVKQSSNSYQNAPPILSSSSENAKPEFVLDLDSAGIYYTESGPSSVGALYWRCKMEILWQNKDTANVIVLGSSRTDQGINSHLISQPFYAINLAVHGNTIAGDYTLLSNYILPHIKRAKVIITAIDIDRWSVTHSGFFESDYKSYPGYIYDKNHNYWKDYYPENLALLTYNAQGSDHYLAKQFRTTRGFETSIAYGWGEPSVSSDSAWINKFSNEYNKNLNTLIKMIKACQQKNIVLIGIITPQNPRYRETGAFGSAGVLRSQAPKLIQQIANLSNKYPNFILMDENKMGDHDYTDDMANDKSHLATKGAEQLTKRLDSLIRTLDIDLSP